MARKLRAKTVRVETLVKVANSILAAPAPSRAERLAVATLLESVLMESGAYRGFRYLEAADLPAGILPGIERDADPSSPTLHAFPDDSRRRYT